MKLIISLDSQPAYMLSEQRNEVYFEFNKWCSQNGLLLSPSLLYPTHFQTHNSSLVGLSAKTIIPSQKSLFAVPNKLIITVDKVRASELGPLLRQNRDLFDPQVNLDSGFNILALWVLIQKLKGDKSQFKWYLRAAQSHQSITTLSKDSLEFIDSKQLLRQILDYKQLMQTTFVKFLRVFNNYPDLFPQESNAFYQALFYQSREFVTTRAFGYGMPSCSLIPFADSLNHGTQGLDHFVYSPQLEQAQRKGYKSAKDKDLSIFKKASKKATKTQSRKTAYLAKHKKYLEKEYSDEDQALQVVNNKRLSNAPLTQLQYFSSSDTEDNDTDQEDIMEKEYKLQLLLQQELQIVQQLSKSQPGKQVITSAKARQLARCKQFMDLIKERSIPTASTRQKRLQLNQEIRQLSQKKQLEADQQKISAESESSGASQEQSQQGEGFEWYNNESECFFVFYGKKQYKAKQQIFNFYGRRNNRFLYLAYGFALPQNKYDSYSFRFILPKKGLKDSPIDRIVKTILYTDSLEAFLEDKTKRTSNCLTEEIRLKQSKVCIRLIQMLRAILIPNFQWRDKNSYRNMVRTAISYELQKMALGLCTEVIKRLLQKSKASEDDQDLMQNKLLPGPVRPLLIIRMNYRKILEAQLKHLKSCDQLLESIRKTRKFNSVSKQAIQYGIQLQRGLPLFY